MPAFSVLTNTSAMNALFKLNQTQKALDMNQSRINTGFKVGSAKDDAATFVVAQGMRSDVAGFKQVRENMALGLSTLGTATKAAEQINEELVSIKEKIIQASNQETGRADIQTAIDRSIQNIQGFTSTATFNGINLVNGVRAQDGETFEVVSSMNRDSSGALSLGKISVAYQDLSIEEAGRGLGMIKDLNVSQGRVSSTSQSFDEGTIRTANIDTDAVSTLAAGDTVALTYVDAEGEEQTLTFTALDSATNSGGAYEFGATDGGAVYNADNASANLTAAINALAQNGGPLAGLGIEASAGASGSGEISVALQGPESVGKIVGFSSTTAAANDLTTTTTEAQAGIAQLDLQINNQLKAGDEIQLTVRNGSDGNDTTITFVVSEKDGQAGGAGGTPDNGELILGTNNKFNLDYEDVVQNGTNTPKTQAEVAQVIADVINNDNTASGVTLDAGAHNALDDAVTSGDFGADFSIQAVGDSVRIIDQTTNADAAASQLVGFGGNAVTGTSLNFDQMLDQLNEAEAHLNSVSATLGAAQKALESQDTYMESLVNAVEDGIGTLVDANMAEESAKFQALQVQQQLGLQALGIANSQPQSILSLFG